jgi:hypothetical protein
MRRSMEGRWGNVALGLAVDLIVGGGRASFVEPRIDLTVVGILAQHPLATISHHDAAFKAGHDA